MCFTLLHPLLVDGKDAGGGRPAAPPRVAVLGAGIGGTSVAYFLSKNLPEAQIDILEMSGTGKCCRSWYSTNRYHTSVTNVC